MERPARVRMRRRNPWVRARRRLLGWNVRFDTKDSGYLARVCRDGDGPHRADKQPPTVQRASGGRSNRPMSQALETC
jgi:hypothetical protein